MFNNFKKKENPSMQVFNWRLVLFVVMIFLNMGSIASAKETMGQWIDRKTGDPVSELDTSQADGGKLTEKNVNPSQPLNEKALVEKNVGLVLPLDGDKPTNIDEKDLVEKNVGMVLPLDGDKPTNVDEKGLVEKNVGLVLPLDGDKATNIDEKGLVEKSVGLAIPLKETPLKTKEEASPLSEEELVAYNLGLTEPVVSNPKKSPIKEGEVAEDSVEKSQTIADPHSTANRLSPPGRLPSVGNAAQTTMSQAHAVGSSGLQNALKVGVTPTKSVTQGLFSN